MHTIPMQEGLLACAGHFLTSQVSPLPLTKEQRAVLRLPVWKYAASFYPAKIVKTAELDPDGNYIFCAHPHGIFCSSLFLAFATEAMDFSRLYPGWFPLS